MPPDGTTRKLGGCDSAAHSLAIVGIVVVAANMARADDSRSVELAPDLRSRCLRILREGLQSDAFWPAMHAAEALSDSGFGAEVREQLWPRLPEEQDDQRRCGLAREIVRSGDRRALPTLFGVLAKDDPYGHTHAAESLYKIADVGDGDGRATTVRENA